MLDLNDLGNRTYHRISSKIGNALAEAAAYCIESQHHQQGDRLTVRGRSNGIFRLVWEPVTAEARRGGNHPDEATEDGAAGIALLLSAVEIGHMVIARSRRNSGFDYLLGDEDVSNASDTERAVTEEMLDILEDDGLVVRGRMEVSGIRENTDSVINGRVNEKLAQTRQTDYLGIPAYVIVVEFGRLIAVVSTR
jgi:hypothetical protein